MHVEHHDLAQEFPEFKEQIHTLKLEDAHFARLFAEYQQVDKAICRSESGIEAMADEALEEMKKLRLHLKDDLYTRLREAAETTE